MKRFYLESGELNVGREDCWVNGFFCVPGVVSSTGRILYECKMSSCSNKTDGDSLVEEDVLIIRRHQHTVRAGEPRTGMERYIGCI